ncbi:MULTISPECIES: DUF6376 family protein [Clostridia]|uniref:DUF6376 family protein n=1 Tax=Clostridia TaxID=186801 RepID=UPI000EA37DCA|nr:MULTISPECIES: DUF6376 family protein [Clostridia]NBJ69856.1 hypothetical protein [Roseburia sp. 1XD42-34]RKI77658.1 hypothetical protein D7V87_10285 [Clostridium sp. 1xD42-85]
MKKIILSMLCFLVLLLSGCSILEEASDSLNYLDEATTYLNDLNNFIEEAASLEKDQLMTRLENLETTITDFINLDPPEAAEDIHQELRNQSELLLDETYRLMEQGELTFEQVKDTDIYQTIENIHSLQNQIEQLEL